MMRFIRWMDKFCNKHPDLVILVVIIVILVALIVGCV